MSVSVWLDTCFRCNNERDKRTMLYKSKKTDAAGQYRRLEAKINESGIVKLHWRQLHAHLCLPCLQDLATWLTDKNAQIVSG